VESAKALLREQLSRTSSYEHTAANWRLDELLERYLQYLDDLGRGVRTRDRYVSVAEELDLANPRRQGRPSDHR
jgi:hypothetical protein